MDPTGKAIGGAAGSGAGSTGEGDGGDRRRHRRVSVRLEVAYEDPERQVFVSTRDLSEGGVFLADSRPPDPGQGASVTFELPDDAPILRLPGVVVRSDPGVGFALRFDSAGFNDATRAQLRRFVGQAQASGL